jgi:hypothetical protein
MVAACWTPVLAHVGHCTVSLVKQFCMLHCEHYFKTVKQTSCTNVKCADIISPRSEDVNWHTITLSLLESCHTSFVITLSSVSADRSCGASESEWKSTFANINQTFTTVLSSQNTKHKYNSITSRMSTLCKFTAARLTSNTVYYTSSHARNGPVYAGIPHRNFFLLNFIPALLNTYNIHLSDGISLFCF